MCVHPGVTGDVIIDDNGDRDTNFAILDMNEHTGQFEVLVVLSFCKHSGDRCCKVNIVVISVVDIVVIGFVNIVVTGVVK